mmetsp:Transcript_18976/g.36954  ORF Transcript_18976/g.36954 Transcript_18976/m.36954 type:complete len:103 (-) Transcript_18976:577-885(-)
MLLEGRELVRMSMTQSLPAKALSERFALATHAPPHLVMRPMTMTQLLPEPEQSLLVMGSVTQNAAFFSNHSQVTAPVRKMPQVGQREKMRSGQQQAGKDLAL